MILVIGPWILFGVGVLMLVMAAAACYRGNEPKKPWIWIFGLAAAGVGVYGPAFLNPLGKFVNPILQMQESPSVETYEAVFEQIGEGKLPPKFQELALAYAFDRPVAGMEEALDRAAQKASDTTGRTALQNAKLEVDARIALAQREVAALAPGGLDQNALSRLRALPSEDRTLAAGELLRRPTRLDSEVRRQIQDLAKPRTRRVPIHRDDSP